MTLPLRLPLPASSPSPLIAELGNDRCAALGIIGRGEAPALDLCRRLVAAGVDPVTPLHVYRGDVLALRIRWIGEGAQLDIVTDSRGTPRFRRHRIRGGAASTVAKTPSTLPSEPPDKNNTPGRQAACATRHGRRP
jgi:hypothetical protein